MEPAGYIRCIWEVVTLTSPSGGGELAFKDARLGTPSDKLAEAIQ